MLLAIDIGNSAIKFGVFAEGSLTSKITIPTKRDYTPEEISLALGSPIGPAIDNAVVCSVVPPVDDAVRQFVERAVNVRPVFIDSKFDFGFKIHYEPIEALGTDRPVNALAAIRKFGEPCIVCSLGTATTIDLVDEQGEFRGGVIAPGIRSLATALHLSAAQLPTVKISKPDSIIGQSTDASIRSGIYYGYAAMVAGLIGKLSSQMKVAAKTIATGGLASEFAQHCLSIDVVDENLTLEGLALCHARM